MSTKTIISIAAAAAIALPAASQVEKEITVEREIIPTLREVSPLTFTPTFQLPAVEKPTLNYSERTVTARIPSLFSFLEPTAAGDSIEASPWRGYVGAGYFPVFYGEVSAGYRLIDAPKTKFDLWLQYDGRRYNADMTTVPGIERASDHVVAQDGAVGFNIDQRIKANSRLDLSLSYAIGRFNNPEHRMSQAWQPYWQTSNRVDFDGLFTGRTNDLGYALGLRYDYFGFARGAEELRPLRENNITLTAALFADIDERQSYRLDIEGSVLTRGASGKSLTELTGQTTFVPRGSDGSGLITITPSYLLAGRKVNLQLGARVDLSISDGKFFHIAPAVKATWMPSPFFAIYGRAGGGEIQNTSSRLYAIDRFMLPVLHYANSHMPIEAEGGLRVGPFRGARLGASVSWAAVNDALMPYALAPGEVVFYGGKLRGARIAFEAGYDWRGKVKAEVIGAIMPQTSGNIERGYYTDYDRARYTLNASLGVCPMRGLEITAEYNLRSSRRMMSYKTVTTDLITNAILYTTRLPNLSEVNLGGSYAINDNLSVFARFENILNRRTPSYSLIESDGFHGLFGLLYKF